jgi:hypothetical protein
MDPNAQAGVKDQISKLQREIKMLRQQLRQPGPEAVPNTPPKAGVNTRAKKAGPRQIPRVIPPKLPVHNATVTPEAQVPAKYNDWPLGVDPTLYCYRYLVGFKIFAPLMPNTPVASIEDLQRYPVVINPLVLTGELITPELYDIVEPLNTPEARMAAIRQHPDSHLSLRSGDLVLWSVEFGAAEDGTVPKIYVRTDTAWYLLIDPVSDYQPLFRALFDKCMLVQNLLDALVVEPRLSLTGPLNKFGIDFNQVKLHSTFLLHHIKSLNDETINNSILVQELTRMAPPEQTLPPILPPGIYLLPQPGQQPVGTTAAVPGAVPALPATTNSATAGKRPHQMTPVTHQPVPSVSHTPVATEPRRGKMPVYGAGPVTSNTNMMANTTPAVSESKFNPANIPLPNYTTKPAYNPNYHAPAAPPTYPSIKLKTNTSYDAQPSNGHQQVNVAPIVAPPQVPAEQPESEHDTTHDELDFETGFDLEGVFVNDSQDDNHIDGLNTSSYFSLS